MNILFVDDEKAILEIYNEEVNSEFPNFKVFNATNGEEALKVCEHNSIHLVVTDGQMPKMDGFQLAMQLKKTTYPAKVALITGHHTDASEPNLKNAGIDKVFLKPIDFDDFIDFLKSFQ